MAQHRVDAADTAIRRALHEAEEPSTRARILGPYVEIVAAAGDLEAAHVAADELVTLADELNQPLLHALAAHMTGIVLLARDDPRAALVSLRAAWRAWRDIDAPHDAARVRVRIALACRALGDDDGAEMELDAARSAFAQLGAAPDVAWVDALSLGAVKGALGGLTTRELEVLALVATGETNRQIAHQLFISEKTVASHLSHIFTKLGVASRSAATAYAFEHDLA
jgi:DNA-binding NarL/FixJ family response regulator